MGARGGGRAVDVAGAVEARATFKPLDVEELVDHWLNRPLASHLVRVLAPLPITPNQVTLLSGAVGVVAGVVMATAPLDGIWHAPLAGALLYLSLLLDCADGQLARLRGESSMVGRMLDGCVDVIPTAAMFVGGLLYLWRAGYDLALLNLIGWSAGLSMRWQTHSYDHAKNVYLRNVLPPSAGPSPLPTLEEIRAEHDAHLARGDRLGALILRGFMHFTRSQRRGWQQGRMGLGVAGTSSTWERQIYRERFRSTMRLWTWNGLALHLFLLILAAFATPVFHGAVLVAWGAMLGPMNVLTVCLMVRERRVEREVTRSLRPGPATFSVG